MIRRASASSSTPAWVSRARRPSGSTSGLAQDLLQAADVLADRRLAELKVGGGAVEAARVHHRDQAAERDDVKDSRHFRSSAPRVRLIDKAPRSNPIQDRRWTLPVIPIILA
jgi:hypothetical protein